MQHAIEIRRKALELSGNKLNSVAIAARLSVPERTVRHWIKKDKALEDEIDPTLKEENQKAASVELKKAQKLDNEFNRTIDASRQAYWKIQKGTMVVFSDAHYYSEEPTLSHLALRAVVRKLQPTAIVCNGDGFEFKTISKHSPNFIGEKRLTPHQEIEIVKTRLKELKSDCPTAITHYNLGNHSIRLEKYIMSQAPALADFGLTMKDIIPDWYPALSLYINKGLAQIPTRLLHAWHSGIHSEFNNVLKTGCHVITSHTHKLTAVAYTDERGERYGISTGFLGDLEDELFNYTFGTTKNWQCGFLVLHFDDYELVNFEFCRVKNGKGYFRNEQIV